MGVEVGGSKGLGVILEQYVVSGFLNAPKSSELQVSYRLNSLKGIIQGIRRGLSSGLFREIYVFHARPPCNAVLLKVSFDCDPWQAESKMMAEVGVLSGLHRA